MLPIGITAASLKNTDAWLPILIVIKLIGRYNLGTGIFKTSQVILKCSKVWKPLGGGAGLSEKAGGTEESPKSKFKRHKELAASQPFLRTPLERSYF